MRKRKVIRTTLGELIVAVTDEVMPFIRDPLGLNMAVACIVTDVLAHNHVRDHISSRRKYPSSLTEKLTQGKNKIEPKLQRVAST